MGKADLHIHSNYSDGINKPEHILKVAFQHGLNIIAITDHNTLDGALKVKELSLTKDTPEVAVIIGEEISSTAGHICGLFLSHVIPRDLEPDETVRHIHDQGGIAIVAHPLASMPKSLNLEALDHLVNHDNPTCRPDAIEVLNGFPWQIKRHSQLLSLNNEFGLAVTAGSDSHGPSSIGCAYTRFEGSSMDDLKKSLLNKTTSAHGHGWPALELIRALSHDSLYRSRKLLPRSKK